MLRHVAAASLGLVVLLGTAMALDHLARYSARPGTVWLLSLEGPSGALRKLPADSDARIVGVWLDGRLLQLHAASLEHDGLQMSRAGIVVRWPFTGFLGAICG